MTSTSGRKIYPKSRVCHQDQPRKHFTQHADHVTCGHGFWKQVTPAQRLAWMQLRTVKEKDWTLNGIINVLGVDRRNFLKLVEKLQALGVVKFENGRIDTIDPEAAEQTKTQQPKKEKVRTEEPVASHKADVVVATPAPVDVVTVPNPVVPRQPAPAPRKIDTAPASLAQSLAEAWNHANTRGWLRTDVDAGAFNAETISTIQYLADKYDQTPEQVVTQVVARGFYDQPDRSHTPAYLFNPKNKDQMGGHFREIVQERRLKRIKAAQAVVDDLQGAIEENVPADIVKNGNMQVDWLSQYPSRNERIDVVALAEQLQNHFGEGDEAAMKMREWGRSIGKKQVESVLYAYLQEKPTAIHPGLKYPANHPKADEYLMEPREVANPKWLEFVPCYDETRDFVATVEAKFLQWNSPVEE